MSLKRAWAVAYLVFGYSRTCRINKPSAPRFLCLTLLRLALSSKLFDCENNRILRRELAEVTGNFEELVSY